MHLLLQLLQFRLEDVAMERQKGQVGRSGTRKVTVIRRILEPEAHITGTQVHKPDMRNVSCIQTKTAIQQLLWHLATYKEMSTQTRAEEKTFL